MHKKYLFVLLSVIAILAVAVFPVGAVSDGEPDGNGHPFVGLMVAYDSDGAALWRCSGTLLSPTVFLTAGHCTEAPAASATVWFDADVQSLATCFDGAIGDPCYPYGGGDSYYGSTVPHTQSSMMHPSLCMMLVLSCLIVLPTTVPMVNSLH